MHRRVPDGREVFRPINGHGYPGPTGRVNVQLDGSEISRPADRGQNHVYLLLWMIVRESKHGATAIRNFEQREDQSATRRR